jgi:anti-sigma B factor antagonist
MSPGSMELEPADGVALLHVAGEHDVYSTQALYDYLDAVLDDGRSIVVDLTDASFVDSSVIAALVSGRRRFAERKSGFAVLLGGDASATMRRTFEITGVMSLIPVFADRAEALAAARRPLA